MKESELKECPFCGSKCERSTTNPFYFTECVGGQILATGKEWNRRAPAWISVEEALPEKDGRYSVAEVSKNPPVVDTSYFYADLKVWSGSFKWTHWMVQATCCADDLTERLCDEILSTRPKPQHPKESVE